MTAAPRGNPDLFERVFGRDRPFWLLVIFATGIVSLLKGLRYPHVWGATQAEVDYRHGLIKRGLFGTLFTNTLHLQTYARFTVFSFAVLGLTFALLIACVYSAGGRRRMGNGEPIALFSSSYAVTCLADMIGYLDVLLLLFALCVVLIRQPWLRFLLAVPVCGAAMLLHESFLLLLLPVVLFSFYTDTVEGRLRLRTAGLLIGVLASLCLAVALLVAARASATHEQAAALQKEVAARVDFPVDEVFFDIFPRSLHNNAGTVKYMMLHDGQYWLHQISATIIFLPVFAVLWLYIREAWRGFGSVNTRFGVLFSFCAAGSPLLLHVLGWDMYRWDAMACVAAFLVLLLVVRAAPLGTLHISPATRNATIFVMLLNMSASEGLLGKSANTYPFVLQGRPLFKFNP